MIPLLTSETQQAIESFLLHPTHALQLVAPLGAGKTYVAEYIASQLLGVTIESLAGNERYVFVAPIKDKTITIEQVRAIIHGLLLKLPDVNARRVIIIEHAEKMTLHAQNALLKTIEEPPDQTTIIITTPDELSILPTVRSRTVALPIRIPTSKELVDYFCSLGYTKVAVERAVRVSAGLPGLTRALLIRDTEHPLVQATERARDILQKTTFERLTLIDELTKDKDDWLATLTMIERMAQVSLQSKHLTTQSAQRWHKVLAASYNAYEQTTASVQVKLVALEFMLSV